MVIHYKDLLAARTWQSLMTLYLLFWLIIFVLYLPASEAGMVSDFTGWAKRLLTHTWYSFLQPWDYHAYQPLYQLSFDIFYGLFGFNPVWWSLAFISLHALAALMVTKFTVHFSTYFRLGLTPHLCIAAGIIWALYPYHAEVVVWKVCQHYILCLIGILLALIYFIKYDENRTKGHLLPCTTLFVITLGTLFSKEYGYLLPLMLGSLGVGHWWTSGKNSLQKTAWSVLASLLAVVCYIFLKRVFIPGKVEADRWGSEVKLDPSYIVATLEKYMAKYLFYTRQFSFEWKEAFHNWITQYWWFVVAAFVIGLISYIASRRRMSNHDIASLTAGSLMVLGWLPTATLYFTFILLGESDRYGYIGSVFFILLLFLLINHLPKFWTYLVVAAYLIANIYFLMDITEKWKENARVQHALVEDFRWYEEDSVYILSIPNNYHGLYLFRSKTQPPTFYDQLKWVAQKNVKNNLIGVNQYNMMSLSDGVHIDKIDSMHWYVEFNQWGNWSWTGPRGASDDEMEKFRIVYEGNGYHLYFKEKPKNAVFIYQDGLKWKKVEY